jgi:putative nucleotidyltransferase with HDIG domain
MLSALASALEARDPYTRGHSARVTALALAVARRLGWNEQQLTAVRLGAALHDVGKLSVSVAVLRKPGPLLPHERAEIQEHPLAGAWLLEDVAVAQPALRCVLHHHERWDGDGYPHRLAAAAIPIEARLVALADAFDAMTSDRPYRSALTHKEALGEVGRCAGTQFDPELAGVFLDVWAERAAAV